MCKWSITYIIMYKQINNSTHHCTSIKHTDHRFFLQYMKEKKNKKKNRKVNSYYNRDL